MALVMLSSTQHLSFARLLCQPLRSTRGVTGGPIVSYTMPLTRLGCRCCAIAPSTSARLHASLRLGGGDGGYRTGVVEVCNGHTSAV